LKLFLVLFYKDFAPTALPGGGCLQPVFSIPDLILLVRHSVGDGGLILSKEIGWSAWQLRHQSKNAKLLARKV
jgi:hypothetical protein